MDMDYPAFTHRDIITTLATTFFNVVPAQYRTYCALNSLICQAALKHFGIASRVIPTEVWYADATHSYFIGVVTGQQPPNKWAGHAICIADGWLIDAALHHFRKEYGCNNVPDIAALPTFGIASNMISRLSLGTAERIWWCHPPHDAEITIPNEPADVVALYGGELAKRVEVIVAEKLTLQLQTMAASADATKSARNP